jgi:adenine deaminase
MSRRELIAVALGSEPADTVITNGRLVNVHSGEIYPAEVAIKGDRIAAVDADCSFAVGDATEFLDAGERYLVPGLIDSHLHCYLSYLGPAEFARGMLLHGITTTTDAFYSAGIVAGKEAVRFFKDAFDATPLRLIFLVPTMAYIQNRSLGLTATDGVSADDMFEMLQWPGCAGLEEPPFLPVGAEDPVILDLFEETLAQRKTITGHASGLSRRQLDAYASVGVSTDHEAVTTSEAVDRIRAGIRVLMRNGSACEDVPALVRAITEARLEPYQTGFCVDVVSPQRLLKVGGVDENVRSAIARGVRPVTAVQMATLRNAETFFLQHEIGAVAPGRFADILLVDDLAQLEIDQVLAGGRIVVKDNQFHAEVPPIDYPASFFDTVRLAHEVSRADLQVEASTDSDEVEVRVIGVNNGSFLTDHRRLRLPVADGHVQPDAQRDILKIAMFDRHGKGTGPSVGFVQGFGLERGALASTVNPVCESVVVVGVDDEDMVAAVEHLARNGGGKVVVADGEVRATIELPVLGLFSLDSLEDLVEKFERAVAVLVELGCTLDDPFSQLEFSCACGEMGDLRMSDEGLVALEPPGRLSVVVDHVDA